jgi:hypothetical protein
MYKNKFIFVGGTEFLSFFFVSWNLLMGKGLLYTGGIVDDEDEGIKGTLNFDRRDC